MTRAMRTIYSAAGLVAVVALFLSAASPATGQQDVTYRKPPKEILELVDVDLPPQTMIDRDTRYLVMLKRSAFKSLEELAATELRLAGLRINPANHDASRARYTLGLGIQEIATGKGIPVVGLPDPVRIEHPQFSPGGHFLSFTHVQPDGMTLWVVELATGRARQVSTAALSAVLGSPCVWSPDETGLYCRVRTSLQPYSDTKELPAGPAVQEATGKKAPSRTFQDLLRNKADESRFEHFAAVELRWLGLDGSARKVLEPGIHRAVDVSPGGRYLLVETIHPPYSYLLPIGSFPYRAYIVDRTGTLVAELVDKPLQDSIPISFDAVEDGRRDFSWRDDLPATVAWVEAQDGGDPDKEAGVRDHLYQLDAPFGGQPRMFAATTNRVRQVRWGDATLAVVSDYWWKTRTVRTYLIDPTKENAQPKPIFEYSSEDLYNLPGDFVTKPNALGRQTLLTNAKRTSLFLEGEGFSPAGNRPFLDEYAFSTGKKTRLWQADGASTYESISRILDIGKKTILTSIQSRTQFPNYYIRTIGSKAPPRQITAFANPFKSFEGVSKEKIHYKREDGVDLSADLYLPAGYDKVRDGRLPMLVEAYPTEFKDAKAAGMVDSSPHQFTYLYWGSPVFWAMRGYAVLENAQFPIVGQGKEEPNDTYIEQLVANARAAIKAVDDRGAVDTKRVAVMGHSYGAFMTVNLLAHSDLFAAGLARSGAYNRSLTPFGFQAEERSYWQAQSVYQKMSPFNYADTIKGALLLIHGDADNNSGTFTMQSERLFQAVKGLGGHARLVLLPYESHGYAAKENILHMLWEMDTWLETWVKNAGTAKP
jgi:dipeptidyl aminopeptidase/acylaminoacyl peptidase